MPRIAGIATEVPPHRIDQESAREFVRDLFGRTRGDIERLLPVFTNAGIETRYFSRPADWFRTPRSFGEKNEAYIESATALGAEVAGRVLREAGVTPDTVDSIIYVNTTGLATPSIDARIANVLGLPRHVRRTPLWGLGCAGGAAGLAHAWSYLNAHPGHRALVVCVELCGLTFVADDCSRSNLVATALFGEGAAAVLVVGDEIESDGPKVVDAHSRFYPDSLDVMGWNVASRGLQVVFAQRIPEIVREQAAVDLDEFLRPHSLGISDISAWLLHPGGRKVLEAYEHALHLDCGQTRFSRETLRDYGNMSSVTVLFVLDRFLRQCPETRGTFLLSALGPGFSSESILLGR